MFFAKNNNLMYNISYLIIIFFVFYLLNKIFNKENYSEVIESNNEKKIAEDLFKCEYSESELLHGKLMPLRCLIKKLDYNLEKKIKQNPQLTDLEITKLQTCKQLEKNLYEKLYNPNHKSYNFFKDFINSENFFKENENIFTEEQKFNLEKLFRGTMKFIENSINIISDCDFIMNE
jgi:hypothetical protein